MVTCQRDWCRAEATHRLIDDKGKRLAGEHLCEACADELIRTFGRVLKVVWTKERLPVGDVLDPGVKGVYRAGAWASNGRGWLVGVGVLVAVGMGVMLLWVNAGIRLLEALGL